MTHSVERPKVISDSEIKLRSIKSDIKVRIATEFRVLMGKETECRNKKNTNFNGGVSLQSN